LGFGFWLDQAKMLTAVMNANLCS
jgi:hypothetical protein